MTLDKLLENRFSVRGFKPDPVDRGVIRSAFRSAQRAASNCNVQPWQSYVVSGQTRKALSKALVAEAIKQNPPNPDFDWTVKYKDLHRERQFGAANALYSAMGIERTDKMKRMVAMLRNWEFFDAPHAVFFTMEKYLNIMGAVDMGIYAQTLSLALQERGVASVFQGALGQFPDPIRDMLSIPQDQGVLFGMSFGYLDPEAPANGARTDRGALEDAVQFFD